MIYLLHGNDSVSSRTFLSKLKTQYDLVKIVNCKGLKGEKIVLPQNEIFAGKGLVVLENLVVKKETTLTKNSDDDIVIWTDELIVPPSWVDKVFSFKISEQISSFKFSDSLSYGQEKISLITLKKLMLQNTPAELVIGSLVRQFKLMIHSLEGEKEKISRSEFMQQKVLDQAKNWNKRKIKTALLLLLKTDLGIKSGKIPAENALTVLVLDICRLVKI